MNEILKNIFIILDKKEKKKFLLLAFLDIIISILDILFLVVLVYVISFYTKQNSKVESTYSYFGILENYPLLFISIFFILFSIKNLVGFYIFNAQFKYVYTVASRLSMQNLLNYLNGTYHNYVNIDSSVHIRRISQQPIEFAQYVLRGIQQIISQTVLILITIIAVLIFNAELFLLLFIILVPPVILTGYLIKKKLNSMRFHTKATSAKTIQHLQESISSYIESNMYDKIEFFTNRYHIFQKRLNSFLSYQQALQNIPSRLLEVFAVFGLFILILINSYYSNTIQIVIIAAFMAAAYKIIPGIVKILNSAGQIKSYRFTVDDLLKTANLHQTKKKYNNINITSIELVNISFGYNGRLINNFSEMMTVGDFIGIYGLSGKGKTTLVNLLLGFLDPHSGEVRINDIIVNNINRQQYWNKISYLKQQPFFIHDTLLKNITLDDSTDYEKLTKVIFATGLDEVINNNADGLNAILTENGKNYSGGQRQRIILARALYKDFDVLILDEPFSELDEQSEIQLLKHLQQLSGEGKIIILITHTKTSLPFCNKKIDMDE